MSEKEFQDKDLENITGGKRAKNIGQQNLETREDEAKSTTQGAHDGLSDLHDH